MITINGVLKKKNTKSKFDPTGLKTGAFEDGFGVKKSASKGNAMLHTMAKFLLMLDKREVCD